MLSLLTGTGIQKYDLRTSLHNIRLNNLGVFSEYAERINSTQKENFHFQQCLGTLKRQY
jgi:hypothetical protein